MGLAFSVAPHMADAFLDDDAPAVMATPGPIPPVWRQSAIPAVSRGAVVGPARASLAQHSLVAARRCSGLIANAPPPHKLPRAAQTFRNRPPRLDEHGQSLHETPVEFQVSNVHELVL